MLQQHRLGNPVRSRRVQHIKQVTLGSTLAFWGFLYLGGDFQKVVLHYCSESEERSRFDSLIIFVEQNESNILAELGVKFFLDGLRKPCRVALHVSVGVIVLELAHAHQVIVVLGFACVALHILSVCTSPRLHIWSYIICD